jgi:signal transduction histidine kinase
MTQQPNSKRWGESFAAFARWTREHGPQSALFDLAAASGVAELSREILHEFNNLMTAVVGYADMASRKLPPGEPARDHVQKSMAAAERAAQLAQQFLAFGRELSRPAPAREIHALIAEKQPLLERFCGSRLRFVSRFGEASRSACIEEDAFLLLVTCFILHARHALQAGGTVELDAAGGDGSRGNLRLLLTSTPTSDQAGELPPDHLDFLQACCGAIAERLHGELNIRSQAGETRLGLELPPARG